MIDQPKIVQTDAQPAAVIHLKIPRLEMQDLMGLAIAEVVNALAGQGIAPAGPVFAHHLSMHPEIFNFEVGFPVTTPVQPAGRVTPSMLPAGTVARTVYHGPYEGLPEAWRAFMEWIDTEGYDPKPNLWECYLTNPDMEPDPAKWRTELNRPIYLINA